MQKTKPFSKNLYFPVRVVQTVREVLDYPLTIVEAPMGYGKTTAVRECLKDAGAEIHWQKVYDRSVSGFWAGFCNMFDKIDQGCARSLLALSFPNDSGTQQEALALILSAAFPEKTVLVIDDYHLAEKPEINAFIEYLIWNEISNVHFILTVRYTRFPNLDEMKSKGYLKYITKETFEFDADEIKTYYKICGISLREHEAEDLYAKTEGWISALYLMMLRYKENGSLFNVSSIEKLLEQAVYEPFADEVKEFLMAICVFDTFNEKQADYVWSKEAPANVIEELVNRNAFINYDAYEKSYTIHSIFRGFLQEKLEAKDQGYREDLYKKAAKWYMDKGEFLTAMDFAYRGNDFATLLRVIELDKGHSFNSEYKDLIIKYFAECPETYKKQYPFAMLVYARRLFTFNEIGLFKTVCKEFMTNLQEMDIADTQYKNRLIGEFELMMSFSGYNDIEKMSEYHQRACELLSEPSTILDSTASWTFGSPSVLYMFHRTVGELEKEVETIWRSMPFYYQLTGGHGKGAEQMMEAERYFYMGDFENAESAVYKVLQTASEANQSGIMICCSFLLIRLAFVKGEFEYKLLKNIRDDVTNKKWYIFIQTIDMCETYIYSCLHSINQIPTWIANGEFKNTRLFFPTMAFLNIVYGRVLLVKGEYTKLIGNVEQFMGLASVFPNLLGQIHTYIYAAAANQKISRNAEALDLLKAALDMAMPDKIYMPFVENCDYIKKLLEELHNQCLYSEDITKIMTLYLPYQKAVEKINKSHFTQDKPELTDREREIAQLAAEGFSNKEIGEKLFITQNTVKTLMKRIFEKLHINSRAMLKQYFEQFV